MLLKLRRRIFHNITLSAEFFVFFQVTNKRPITVLDILEKIRLHVSVPQCDVFGYLSIESEIVILIIPVDQNPKPLQVDDVIIDLPSMDLLHFCMCRMVLVSQADTLCVIWLLMPCYVQLSSNLAPTSVPFSSRNSPKCYQDFGRKVLLAWSALTPCAAGAVRFLGGGGPWNQRPPLLTSLVVAIAELDTPQLSKL